MVIANEACFAAKVILERDQNQQALGRSKRAQRVGVADDQSAP